MITRPRQTRREPVPEERSPSPELGQRPGAVEGERRMRSRFPVAVLVNQFHVRSRRGAGGRYARERGGPDPGQAHRRPGDGHAGVSAQERRPLAHRALRPSNWATAPPCPPRASSRTSRWKSPARMNAPITPTPSSSPGRAVARRRPRPVPDQLRPAEPIARRAARASTRPSWCGNGGRASAKAT